MTVDQKLNVHLEHIVMPLDMPMNAKQILELCDQADYAQRMAAIDRARVKIPFLLPDEEREAQKWAEIGSTKPQDGDCRSLRAPGRAVMAGVVG